MVLIQQLVLVLKLEPVTLNGAKLDLRELVKRVQWGKKIHLKTLKM